MIIMIVETQKINFLSGYKPVAREPVRPEPNYLSQSCAANLQTIMADLDIACLQFTM